MNASLQEQLKQIRKQLKPEEPDPAKPRVRRWVVWTKRGEEISKFCTFDSHEEV
jgi:hypothetical protein